MNLPNTNQRMIDCIFEEEQRYDVSGGTIPLSNARTLQ